MTTAARKQGDLGFQRRGLESQAVFEQDGIVAAQALQFGGQQAKGGDGGKRDAVLDGHQLRVAVDRRNPASDQSRKR